MTTKCVDQLIKLLKKEYKNKRTALHYSTPFELLVATILSAQCTDVRVNKVTKVLYEKYNTPKEILDLGINDLKKYIKTCGIYNQKAKNIIATCKILVNEYDSQVPKSRKELIKLPGVGRKTANVVLADAFDIPAIAVDTHVKRVSYRIGFTKSKNVLTIEKDLMNILPKEHWVMMHHSIIRHGRKVCKARNPECHQCVISGLCNKTDVSK